MPAVVVTVDAVIDVGLPDVAADVVTLRYREALVQHLPTGLAWVFEEDTAMGRLVTGVAKCFGRIDVFERAVVRQLDPRTADFGLVDWERVLRLDLAGLTLAQKRTKVMAAVRARGGQSIPYWTAFLEGLGYENVVVESLEDRFRCGDRIRKRLQGHAWAYTIKISANSIPDLDEQMMASVKKAAKTTTIVHFELT